MPEKSGAASAARSNFIMSAVFVLALMLVLPVSAQAQNSSYKRTSEKYAVPDITLVDQNGKRIRLGSVIASDKPVIVDFIFGTCTTVCPVLSAGYASLQQRMGSDSDKIHLISISIDPENDTPAVMKDYLKRYRAKQGWDFLTGSRKDIERVMKAFDAYIPNKMSHYPVTFIRSPKEDNWIRISGMMSTSDFIAESRKAGIK